MPTPNLIHLYSTRIYLSTQKLVEIPLINSVYKYFAIAKTEICKNWLTEVGGGPDKVCWVGEISKNW